MGKKQHQKDKMYLTASEWASFYGGKKAAVGSNKGTFKKLPFYCCSLSLQPFEDPLATPEGVVFDLSHVVPYVNKHGVNPVTGKPFAVKDLVKIRYHKNSDGKYHCPVTYKVFNENSHIVAIRTTGNVYSYEAINQLNIKPGHMKDLLTDESFSKGDILTLQDPAHPEVWDISKFYCVKQEEVEGQKNSGSSSTVRQMNPETKATLQSLAKDFPRKLQEPKESKKEDKPKSIKEAHYSTGLVSSSFTSTIVVPQTENEAAIIDHNTRLYQMIKKKGYVRIQTSFGDLNFELHCDLVPITCHNFIKLCNNGYYNNTVFHRSIKNFMIQGGDPSGTGKGGHSAWQKAFKDEFKANLTHAGRGVLSMANSGPNTNKSQFFITYRWCRHLDGKHTVFGRLVGGFEVLTEMEVVSTDRNDKPLEDITIIGTTVFVNPYNEAELQIKMEDKHTESPRTASSELITKIFTGGKVGKYINTTKRKSETEDTHADKKIKLDSTPHASSTCQL